MKSLGASEERLYVDDSWSGCYRRHRFKMQEAPEDA